MWSGETNVKSEKQAFNSVSELLLDADEELDMLFNVARDSLCNGNQQGYAFASRRQTEIVAGLSEQLDDYRSSGGQVSEVAAAFVASHSDLACQTLEQGRDYPHAAFFPVGTDRHGPSTLRQLAEEL